jgi:hypothetical protein
LRNKNEFDAANEIARNTIEIVSTFNSVTAPWDMGMFYMAPPPARPNPGLANAGTASQPRPAVGTWASVAATAVQKKSSIVKFEPSDSVVKQYAEPEANPEDLRVVWVQGWKQGRPLGQISEYVTQGPICSMAYAAEHGSVCIVFQHAESARDLLQVCALYEAEEGTSLFGPGCTAMLGQAYPMCDDVRRMSVPHHERRRLSFARSQLFAHGMTETLFRSHIYELVGASNVELVWLFNTGNGKNLPHRP